MTFCWALLETGNKRAHHWLLAVERLFALCLFETGSHLRLSMRPRMTLISWPSFFYIPLYSGIARFTTTLTNDVIFLINGWCKTRLNCVPIQAGFASVTVGEPPSLGWVGQLHLCQVCDKHIQSWHWEGTRRMVSSMPWLHLENLSKN